MLFNSKYEVQIDQPLLPGDINPRTRSVSESVGLVHQAAIPLVLPIGLDSIRILRHWHHRDHHDESDMTTSRRDDVVIHPCA